MARKIIFCKAEGVQVNKETRCPDQECETCQEVNVTTKGTARHRSIKFSDSERKVFLIGSFEFGLEIYLFLDNLIAGFDYEEFIKHYWSFTDSLKYLKGLSHNPEALEGNKLEAYIENLHNLYSLISRNIKRKKNIPLDCLLIAYTSGNRNLNIEALAEALADKGITDINSETLQRHISRVRDTKYLWQITNLTINIMPLLPESTIKPPDRIFNFFKNEPDSLI